MFGGQLTVFAQTTTTTTVPEAVDAAQRLAERLNVSLPAWFLSLIAIVSLTAPFATGAVKGGTGVLRAVGWFDKHRKRNRLPERERRRRSNFAYQLKTQIQRMNEQEDWSDLRFTELETEVEFEAEKKGGFLRGGNRARETLRRLPSLRAAMERTDQALVILEGEPGSGKSMALRHVAENMAEEAERSIDKGSTIPIYVNLREFPPDGQIAGESIKQFVLKSVNKQNLSLIEDYLKTNFDEGVIDGTWLFLLDSFDELPAVLSATEADAIVAEYVEAMYGFAHGMHPCRTVIASREFRGPKTSGWKRFRLLPLSPRQQADLIEKRDLRPSEEEIIREGLPKASDAVRRFADNPLFLGLLCEHVKTEKSFPDNTHEVFERYVGRRLERDRKLLTEKFHLSPAEVRRVAEEVAFTMTSTPGLGLNPERRRLREAHRDAGFAGTGVVEKSLSALQSVHLAQTEAGGMDGSQTFKFSHRRFQEYFATCVVLRERNRVTPHDLLTDGSWRETVVAILQTQPADQVAPIIAEARRLLADKMATVQPISPPKSGSDGGPDTEPGPSFAWPAGSLHMLDLLNAAYSGRSRELHPELKQNAGTLLSLASAHGERHDRNWALQFAGVVEPDTFVSLVRWAFKTKSAWLREIVLRQVGRLPSIPDDVAREVRLVLVSMSARGRLAQERESVDAQLKRIPRPEPFLAVARLLANIPLIDFYLAITLSFAAVQLMSAQTSITTFGFFVASVFFVHLTSRTIRDSIAEALSTGWGRPKKSASEAEKPMQPTEDAVKPQQIHGFQWRSTLGLTIALSARYVLLIGALIRFTEDSGLAASALLALTLYYVAWAPSALFLAVRGRCLRPAVLWMIGPFYTPIGGGQLALAKLRELKQKGWRSYGAWLLAPPLYAVVIFAVSRALDGMGSGVSNVFTVLFIIAVVAGVLGLLIAFYSNVRLVRADRLLSEQLSKQLTNDPAAGIMHAVRTLKTQDGMLNFFRRVSETRATENAPEAIVVIRDLVRGAERVAEVTAQRQFVVAADFEGIVFQDQAVKSWVADDFSAVVGQLALLDNDCLDELAKLVTASRAMAGVRSW